MTITKQETNNPAGLWFLEQVRFGQWSAVKKNPDLKAWALREGLVKGQELTEAGRRMLEGENLGFWEGPKQDAGGAP